MTEREPGCGASAAADERRLAMKFGTGFLDELVDWLFDRHGVAVAMVGQLEVGSTDRLRVVSSKSRESVSMPGGYALTNTLCERVVHRGEEDCQLQGLRERFPGNAFLMENSLESYVGVPIVDSNEIPIGVFCIYSDQALADPQPIFRSLRHYAGRIGHELDRMESLETLQAIVTGTSCLTSNEALQKLALAASDALRARVCFIGECIDDDPDHFRVVAFSHQGALVRELEGRLNAYDNTPCLSLKDQDKIVFPRDVRRSFPGNVGLEELSAEAYVGTVLEDGAGQVIGHIAVIHDSPFNDRIIKSPILEAFATRAASELARQRAEERRQNAELSLVASHKMESLGLMAGAIAHDLNNLLVGMLGNAELAQDRLAEPEAVSSHLTSLEHSALRAKGMIRQLLDFAGNDLDQDRKIVDLSAVALEGRQLIPASLYPHARVELQAPPAPLQIEADPIQLTRVVLNLAMNALEGLPDGAGSVRIATRSVSLSDSERAKLLFGGEGLPGDCALLEVTDDGSGIDAAAMAKVFDPFFSTKPDGRGLGLSVVQGIVKSHGGAVSLTTLEGRGTTVSIYFRRLEAGAEALLAEPATSRGAVNRKAGLRALVVDDEAEVRSVIGQQLRLLGCATELAGSGKSGLARLTEGGDFDCALIDVTMPEMDGWAVLTALHELRPGLPVLMMSGYADAEKIGRIEPGGAVSFIAKPFGRKELSEKLWALLDRSAL